MAPDLLSIVLPAALLGGLLYASVEDWRRREVGDTVWRVLAAVGAVGGAVAFGASSAPAFAAWVAAAALVGEHLIPWDVRLERISESLPGYVELAGYAAVTLVLVALGATYGIGPDGLPLAALAVVVTVLLARGLFEIGVLYGGADAKALMVAGLLVPLAPAPWLPLSAGAVAVLAYYPFALNLLIDAALIALAVPIALAIRNLRRGQFEFPRGFTSYVIPVDRLEHEFVWLRDPFLDPNGDDASTAEEDRELRHRQRLELEARGVRTVWVTPQLPFILVLSVGAVLALLAGNLLFDVAAAL